MITEQINKHNIIPIPKINFIGNKGFKLKNENPIITKFKKRKFIKLFLMITRNTVMIN